MNDMNSSAILTVDPSMQKILQMAESVASSKASVLISGESGTGKELLARFIHGKSPRATKKMVAINCAAVPEGLLESELFGHEKGAFTGAIATKIGKFELAQGSTLLLDEMSEMPLLLQSKLLRVIQEGELERVGGNQTVKVNVRIISTTNRDLHTMVAEGLFREDLFYRLNVIPIRIPPLRSRQGDLEMLSRQLVESSSVENGKPIRSLSQEALERIASWSWPGNIRELINVIERAVLLSKTQIIHPEDIEVGTVGAEKDGDGLSAGMTIQAAEKALIIKTLDFTGQNRTHAAKLLGISIRTLRNKLQEYRRELVV